MIIDFRKNRTNVTPVFIKNIQIDQVDTYKYLGLILDNKLNWSPNTDAIIKKLRSRMYCLRKLKSFDVNTKILNTFYSSMINSVLTFGLSTWGAIFLKWTKIS